MDDLLSEHPTFLKLCKYIVHLKGLQWPNKIEDINLKNIYLLSFEGSIKVRFIKLEGEWWKRTVEPLIVFSKKSSRYFAFIPNDGKKPYLYDIKTNKKYSLNNFSSYSEGLTFDGPIKQESIINEIKEKLFTKPYVKQMCIFSLLIAFVSSLIPLLTSYIFDCLVSHSPYSNIIVVIFIFSLTSCGYIIFMFLYAILGIRLEGMITLDLMSKFWEHILETKLSSWHNYILGDISHRCIEIKVLIQTFIRSFIKCLSEGLILSFSFILMIYFQKDLSLLVGLLGLILIVLNVSYGTIISKADAKAKAVLGKLSTLSLEIVTNIKSIKTMGIESTIYHQWTKIFESYKGQTFQVFQYVNQVSIWGGLFSIVITCSVYFSIHINSIQTSIGNFIGFLIALSQYLLALAAFVTELIMLLKIISVQDRINPILKLPRENSYENDHPGKLSGLIEIRNVTFTYKSQSNHALERVSIRIYPKQHIALVGPTGCGKSTLLKLLLGFEKPDTGEILYDNKPLTSLNLKLVRSQIGTVLQGEDLLAGSILSNILGGQSSFANEQLWDAIKQTGLEKDLEKYPNKFDAILKDQGGTLSGGQKQKVMLTRAFALQPKIFLLDEATSALDNNSQAIVIESLKKTNATCIIIAHRLTTIQHCDHIYLFNEGKIVDQGSFEELKKRSDLFLSLMKHPAA